MRKRILSVLLCVCMMFSLAPMEFLTVSATRSSKGTNTSDEWQTGQTKNLLGLVQNQSLTSQGWNLNGESVNDKVYKYSDAGASLSSSFGSVIRAKGNNIGTRKYGGGIYYPITLSETDRVRAAKGDLTFKAGALHWLQAAASTYVSLRAEFYDKNGSYISDIERKHQEENPGVYDDTYRHSISGSVPTNTASIRFWFTHYNTLTNDARIGDLTFYIYDSTAPAFSSAAVTAGKTVKAFLWNSLKGLVPYISNVLSIQ